MTRAIDEKGYDTPAAEIAMRECIFEQGKFMPMIV